MKKQMFKKIISIPRSLFYCIKFLGWGGVKCPFLFANNVRIKCAKGGKVELSEIRSFQIQFGFSGSSGIQELKGSSLIIGDSGKVKFEGRAKFGTGTSIRVEKGILTFGNNFSCNKNCFISCDQSISFGDNVLCGWNINIRDSDGHTIFCDGNKKESLSSVNVGNHVWIGSFVDILKGSEIPDECVVGYRSLCVRKYTVKNALIVGNPAVVKKTNIQWSL